MDPSLIAACVLAGALLLVTCAMAVSGLLALLSRSPAQRCAECRHERLFPAWVSLERCWLCRHHDVMRAVTLPWLRLHVRH